MILQQDNASTPPHRRALRWLSVGVPLAFVIAILCGILLPVYTDEVGWRFQERAGFDGMDKLFAEQCGANTLAVPPFFMWPARWYSALFNSLFADPFYVRLSGILYALAFGALLWAVIRRAGRDAEGRARLTIVGFGLLCLGNMPLLMVLSRPEQPLILTAAGAVLIALAGSGAQGDAATAAGTAWWRSLAILALGAIGLSYHVKGLFLVPLMLGCIWLASRGRAALAPRLLAGGVLVIITAMAADYWVHRLQCPDDAVLKAAYAANNIGALLAEARGWDIVPLVGRVIGNISIFQYVAAAAPNPNPLSDWLPAGQISESGGFRWFLFLVFVWGLAMAAGVLRLIAAGREGLGARRLDPRFVLAVLVLAAVVGWSATQAIRNFYEAGFVLPLLTLAIILALAGASAGGWRGREANVVVAVIGLAALVSPVLISGVWGKALLRSSAQHGYIAEQPVSVSAFGYGGLADQIRETARLCRIPEPAKARAVMIDDLTYFPFMRSHLPQHQLGVIGLWKGEVSDPMAYLRSRGSDGAVLGCHFLPPELRARAKRNGKFCCLGPRD